MLLCGVVMLAGCSAKSDRRWLVMFFDGVEKTASVDKDKGERKVVPVTGPVMTAQPVVVNPIYFHPLYKERKCQTCHLGVFSQKLCAPVTTLCLGCHKGRILTGKVVHLPVAAGECLSCHHSHQSPEAHMLIRRGQALCLECHDEKEMVKARGHETMGSNACQSCHNPHSSDEKRLLRTK
jgi:predicted CXXCH cytochrome family protein